MKRMLDTKATIYLAGRYDRRLELCEYKSQLENSGYKVNSRWLSGYHVIAAGLDEKTNYLASQEVHEWMASEDWSDVCTADILVFFSEPADTDSRRGGRHVELGAALALKKRCLIVGRRENVFHYLPDIEFYETWQSALSSLNESA